ncbi:MAG TPA: tRNA 2-thiouridine(34) synthase MnmA [Candidatus Paceibacterota bacterium]
MKSLKVVVGLSGGVDSAVSAALLTRLHASRHEPGVEIVGAFIKTWHPEWMEDKCSWRAERRDAMRVAAHLDIPFITVDLEKEYKRGVADYMIAEYTAGRTPNPDVMCNKEIKFGAFLKHALKLEADMIATGHYAQSIPPRTSSRSSLNVREGRGGIRLLRGADPAKDQSYFLWTLNQEQLSKTIFPVGHLLKSQVRQLAKEFGLPVAEKRDSQGICFLGNVDMKDFLSHYIKTKLGDVLDEKGKVIGKHDGAVFYTIGQVWKKPWSAVSKDIDRNTITVAKKYPTPDFVSTLPYSKGGHGRDTIDLRDVNWISGLVPSARTLAAQTRYHGEKYPIILTVPNSVSNSCEVEFTQPTLVAPGQSVVVYDGDICLGGGIVA